MSIISDLLVR